MFNISTKLDRILSQCIQMIEEKGWTVEQCLERYPQDRAELEPILHTALRLRKARSVRPSVEFRSNAQKRIRLRLNSSRRSPWLSKSMSAAPRSGMLESLSSLFQHLGSAQWAATFLLIMIILVGTGGGVAYAADSAKPGDFLYGVDRGIEQIRIKFESNTQNVVRLHLQFADERLVEASQLVESGETERIALVIQEYKEHIAATTPLIVVAHIAGEDVQLLVKETNEAIYVQEQKLAELIESVPVEVEEVIKITLKDIKEIRIVVEAPLPTRVPTLLPLSSPLPSPTYLSPPSTKSPQPPPTSWPTSTGTFIPGPSPTIGSQIPYASPTAPPNPSGTPTATTNPYVTTTPTGTITITVTPIDTNTPWPTYTPTPTRTKTPVATYTVTPTRTGTPTGTDDG